MLIRTALDLLRLDDRVKTLTAILIGVIPIIAIELNGSHILKFFRWHGERIEKRRGWIFSAALLSVIGGATVLFILFMGVVRSEGFSSSSEFSDASGAYLISLAAALAFLQIVATAAAVGLTRLQADGDGWRKFDADVKEHKKQARNWEDTLVQFDVEHEKLSARRLVFRAIAEQYHRAILAAAAARDSCYRTIFCRIRPSAQQTSVEDWNAWQLALITELEPIYASFEPERSAGQQKSPLTEDDSDDGLAVVAETAEADAQQSAAPAEPEEPQDTLSVQASSGADPSPGEEPPEQRPASSDLDGS